MVHVELFKMCFQIDVRNLLGCKNFQTGRLVKIIINFPGEPHERFIFPRKFKLHQVLRNQLLGLNLMEMLLIRDEVSCGFFGVLQLLEFDYQYIV